MCIDDVEANAKSLFQDGKEKGTKENELMGELKESTLKENDTDTKSKFLFVTHI